MVRPFTSGHSELSRSAATAICFPGCTCATGGLRAVSSVDYGTDSWLGASGGSSGGTSGDSSGDSCFPGDSGKAGVEFTQGLVKNAVAVYGVEHDHEKDDEYRKNAKSTPFRGYHLFNNNCCHWARKVIHKSGGKWPISHSINWGVNPGAD